VLSLTLGFTHFLMLIYLSYLIILLNNFSKSFPKYQLIVEQLNQKEHRELNHDLSPEKNDEEIINLGVNLKSENDRMDAYVIEAALFGALAFSGFVQLISVGDLSADYIEKFHHHIQVLMSYIINTKVTDFDASIDFLFSKEGLIIFLSYQTLLCSVFFLSVIASRLRYSKLTDAINRSLELAKSMNEKEELLLKENSEKYLYYNENIKTLLKQGYQKQDEIEPIMSFMKFFRTLGIGMFFMIIVFSGIFISSWFSFILLIVSVLSIVYFKLSLVKKRIKHFYISIQEFYFRFNNIINWACWSLILLSVFFRSFGFEFSSVIMFFGFTFLFIHTLMKLVIPVQFDFDVKKENDAFNSYVNFQKILAVIFNVSLALFFLGFMFKAQHWPFAGILIIVSLFIMAFYFLFVKKTHNKNTFLQVILSLTIFVCLFGIMFRFQNWEGSSLLKYCSAILILISTILTILYRENIRKSIQKTVYILFMLSLLFISEYLRHSISVLNFSYSYYSESKKTNLIVVELYQKSERFIEIINDNKNYEENQKEVHVITDKIDSLLFKVNSLFHNLNLIINETANSTIQDEYILNKVEFWAKNQCIADPYWESKMAYASILIKNKKYEEALKYAISAKKERNNEESRKMIKKIRALWKKSILG
jgi:hypothetical protein